MNKKLLICLSLLVIIVANNATMESSCIEAQPVENFESEKFHGLWYGYAKSGVRNVACVEYFFYAREEDDTVKMVKLAKDKSDNSAKIQLRKIQLDRSGQGKKGGSNKLTIVATDYSDYTLMFACYESKKQGSFTLLTADAKPDSEILDTVNKTLEEYNISIDDLSVVDRSDCPSDWSNAQKNEVDFKYDDVKEDLQVLGIVK